MIFALLWIPFVLISNRLRRRKPSWWLTWHIYQFNKGLGSR